MLSVYAPEHPEISEVLFDPKYENTEPQKVLVFRFDSPDKKTNWKSYSKDDPLIVSVWRPDKFESLISGRSNRSVTPDGEVYTLINSKYVPDSKYRVHLLMEKGRNVSAR